jgi:parallel beta-helix repeat protein
MKSGKEIAMGVLLALTLAFIAFTGIASASTIYVPEDSTIQAAVNAAYPGDTIIVRDGTYTENIKVDKKRLTIRSENGPDSTIIRAEYPDDYVFEVTVDYVKISGFTVGGTNTRSAGIYLYYADYCSISNNNCTNSKVGISLDYSNYNSISDNNCTNNEEDGISLEYSNYNSISDNNCLNNTNWEGICLLYSNKNNISNNNCLNNDDGIWLAHSNNNSISNNNCSSNNWAGILFEISNNNNSISNNKYSNNRHGIVLGCSNNNLIYLNSFINNTYNVYSFESTNTWDSNEKINYTYNDSTYTNYLGNYWRDYKEKYPDAEEIDLTGIWDTPYSINSDADNYPLVEPWENYFAPPERPSEIAPSERQSKIIYFILRWILED